jgi:hypothetical protein
VFFDLIAFYGTGHLDGTAKQQEFFRQCGFTGIGVRNDRKSSPFLDLTIVFHAAAKLNENSYWLIAIYGCGRSDLWPRIPKFAHA